MHSRLVITHDGKPKMLLCDKCELSELKINYPGELICTDIFVTLDHIRNEILPTYLIQTDKYEIIAYHHDGRHVIIPDCYLSDPSHSHAKLRQIKSARSI